MKPPFKKFLVLTGNGPNEFILMTTDLATALKMFEGKTEMPTEVESHKLALLALRRAIFIEDAIREKLEREDLSGS